MGSSQSVLHKKSTAREVVEHFAAASGASPTSLLAGKTALVTGGNSGIGLETVKALSFAGCRVIATSRDVAAGQRIITSELSGAGAPNSPYAGNSDLVTVLPLDLESLSSIRELASAVASEPLDFVIFNAGIMALPKREETPCGWEKQIGTNGHGHWYLASLLRPQLVRRASPCRIVWVSSTAHRMGGVDVNDLHFKLGRVYSPWTAYGQSKKANMLHARELSDQLAVEAPHVVPVSLHPGVIVTNLARHTGLSSITSALFSTLVADKTIAQGASTTLFAALAPDVMRGAYFSDCAPCGADAEGEDKGGLLRRALWAATAKDVEAALASGK